MTETTPPAGSMAAAITFTVIGLIVAVLMIAAMWKIYSKANQPGWAAIIPIYNTYVLVKVAGRPGWWLVLFFIPLVNLIAWIIVAIDMAKAFGKGGAFGFFGLVLFPFIGYPVLGFGGAQYVGTDSGSVAGPPPAPATA